MGKGEGSGEGWGEGEGQGYGEGMGAAEWKHGLFGCMSDGGNCKLFAKLFLKLVHHYIYYENTVHHFIHAKIIYFLYFRFMRMVLWSLSFMPKCKQDGRKPSTLLSTELHHPMYTPIFTSSEIKRTEWNRRRNLA